MSNIVVISRFNFAVIQSVENKVIVRLVKMGYAMGNRAQSNAPLLTGALKNTIRVSQPHDGIVLVSAGGSYAGHNVDYAAIREKENRAHPWTTRYMGRAFDDISKNYLSYFKGIIG